MKFLKVVLVAVSFMAFSATVNAQDSDKQRQSREQMVETQAAHIAKDLALDDKVYGRFITTYVNYKKEMWATAPKRPKKRPEASESENQAAANMQRRFEQSQKVLDIRSKYYKEFSKFLSQKQIELMYDKERKMMKRLSERHRKRPEKRR